MANKDIVELGKKNYEEAQKFFGMSMLIYLVASAVITTAGLLFLDPLLHLFGIPPEALPYGRSYLSVSLYGTIFVMLAAGTLYGAGVVLSRARTMILERERRSAWIQKTALEGKL